MKKTKLLLTLLCLWVGLLPALAQSVTIVKEMQKNPYANVLVMYKNDFGSFEKPDMSITFPYALIRMHLEGNAHEVKAAKERLTLDMGQLMGVEARVTTYSNQILFLLRAPRHPMIYIDGGDGCDQVLLSNMQQLQPNCLYDCTVRFTLEKNSNEVVEVMDKNALLDELRAELANMVQAQQESQNEDIQVEEEPVDTIVEESIATVVQEDTLSKYQRYAQNAKLKTLVIGQIGYSVAPQMSYGAMLGQMYGGYGWYVRARSNFQFGEKTIASCDANGMVDGGQLFYSGNTQTTHFVINGGFTMNCLEKATKNKFNTLGFYVGAGYGKRELQWETTDGNWIAYAPTSASGFSGNVGLIGSVCGLTLNVGVTTINFKCVELELGIGFVF